MTLPELATVSALVRHLRGLPPVALASAHDRGGAYPLALLEQLDCWAYARADRAALLAEQHRRRLFYHDGALLFMRDEVGVVLPE